MSGFNSYAVGLSSIDSAESAWRAFGASLISEGYELPAWTEWEGLDTPPSRQNWKRAKLYARYASQFLTGLTSAARRAGDRWKAELHALNEVAPLCIRVNRLKATKENVIDFLETENIPFRLSDAAPDLSSRGQKESSQHLRLQSGWFEIQDVSSQAVTAARSSSRHDRHRRLCRAPAANTPYRIPDAKQRRDLRYRRLRGQLRELDSRARRNGATIITPTFYIEGMEIRCAAMPIGYCWMCLLSMASSAAILIPSKSYP